MGVKGCLFYYAFLEETGQAKRRGRDSRPESEIPTINIFLPPTTPGIIIWVRVMLWSEQARLEAPSGIRMIHDSEDDKAEIA
mmetsp:Transcript_16630/g.25816  ORF Transcript_16630/g.25816 Transcript_16630/m.25816 type:complete len:82 (+) Transcript_16630:2283-2528(+)